jgi:dimethylsulfone monooxygenase
MRLGIWTPLPHTLAPEARMDTAIEDLRVTGRGHGIDGSLRLAIDVVTKAEANGFDITLIAARHLGPDLEAWTLSTALAMRTKTIEIMVAAHPGIIQPQMVAKLGASLDRISGGRLALNVVNGWNVEEFDTFGNGAWQFSEEDRYRRMDEFVQVTKGLWTIDPFNFQGEFYRVNNSGLPLKPRRAPAPPIYAASRSAEGKKTIARYCDHWFVPDLRDFRLHEGTLDLVRREIADMNELAASHGREVGYGMSANVVCGSSLEEAWAKAERLEQHGRAARYNRSSVSGLGACLVGTPEIIAERLCAYESAGLKLMLLQFNPMDAGLDQFISEVLPLLGNARGTLATVKS